MAVLVVLALSSGVAAPRAVAGADRSADEPMAMVVLGNSIPVTARICPGCRSFPEIYARERSKDGRPITVASYAVPGALIGETAGLLARDRTVRRAVADAAIVSITVGHNDTPWNSRDDLCDGDHDWRTFVDWSWLLYQGDCLAGELQRYRTQLEAMLDDIDALRAGQATTIFLTGIYDDWNGRAGMTAEAGPAVIAVLDAFNATTAEVADERGAVFVDVMHAFNGSDGTAAATPLLVRDHIHPNADGQRLIADLMLTADGSSTASTG
jgi:lysophospholipase L1-like esterase